MGQEKGGTLTGLLLLLLALIGGLVPSADLTAPAQARAQAMVEQGTMNHALSTYPAGYCGVGELLARGGDATTPAGVLAAWRGSPPHAFVLDTLRADRAGVGRAVGDDGTTIWVLALARTC